MAPLTPETTPHDASEALAYIKQTMETATTFTGVSGWGLVGTGVIGTIAAWLASAANQPAALMIWIPAGFLAVAVATSMNGIKTVRMGLPLWSGAVRKMAWGLVPALAAGAALTLALSTRGLTNLLPGMWLAIYGAGVSASASFSIRALRWMGLGLLVLGAMALQWPEHSVVLLATGFGVLHIVVGAYVVVRHGG